MNDPDHYSQAERCAAEAATALEQGNVAEAAVLAAIGQVHATLAAAPAAAAVQGANLGRESWQAAIVPKPVVGEAAGSGGKPLSCPSCGAGASFIDFGTPEGLEPFDRWDCMRCGHKWETPNPPGSSEG